MATSSSLGPAGSNNTPGASGGVVVWEWLNEFGRWCQYDPEIVAYIENMGHISPQVPLGAVSQGLRIYLIDIPSMCQVRQGTGTSRPVRRVIYPPNSPPGQQVRWDWEGDITGSWHLYDIEIAQLLEEGYRRGHHVVDLSSSQFRLPYHIYFSTMQQVRIETGKARNIRRAVLNRPYPSASGAPNSLSKLTSPLIPTNTAHQPSTSTSLHHQTTSGTPGASSLAGAIASTSSSQKRRYTALTSDSSTDSDPDLDSSRSKHRSRPAKLRVLKKTKGAVNNSSSSRRSSGSHSMTPASNGVTVPTSAHSNSSTLQTSLASHLNVMSSRQVSTSSSQQQPILVSAVAPISNPVYPSPLSLFTYNQPLAANLHHGLPPLSHLSTSTAMQGQASQLLQQRANSLGKWAGMPVVTMPTSSQAISMIPSSQAGSMMLLPSLSGHGPSGSYHGPLTRNRLSGLQTQSQMGGTSSMSAGSSMVGMNGMNTNMMSLMTGYGSTLGSNGILPGIIQHQHQLHHPQGIGYHFSTPSGFGPGLGMNIVAPSGLSALSTSTKSGHNNRIAPSASGVGPQPNTSAAHLTESLPPMQKIVLSKMKKTKPKTAEEVLHRYMEIIGPLENEDCCICCDALTAPSSYGEGKQGQFDVIQLNKCSHMFHRLCLLAMYEGSHNGDSICCPTCKTIYGEYLGNCPPGEMTFDIIQQSLPGFPQCNTIRIIYNIDPGVQGPEHPHPGRRYNSRGFPRVGYLPDTDRGRKILKMLIVAFKRRLMFTIGMSATTGESDTVTWNEIHHKTEFGSNVSGHGYPDPNYLDNVTAELAVKGVTEQDL